MMTYFLSLSLQYYCGWLVDVYASVANSFRCVWVDIVYLDSNGVCPRVQALFVRAVSIYTLNTFTNSLLKYRLLSHIKCLYRLSYMATYWLYIYVAYDIILHLRFSVYVARYSRRPVYK